MRDTKALQTARESERNPYARRFPYPKWNVTVTVLDEYRLFPRLPEFTGWTHAQHVAVAIEYLTLAHITNGMYGATCDAMIRAFGDGSGVLVSGVYRDHFPETVKTDLRTLAHTATDYHARSLAHWQASGRRLTTWRAMRDRLLNTR